MDVIHKKENFVLVKAQENFFMFGNAEHFRNLDIFPVNQCGTLGEIKETLKSWKDIDKNNSFMKEIENNFIEYIEKNSR